MRGLADEFGESTNAVRVELNRLEKAGILKSSPNGRTKQYGANKRHPLFSDISSLVKKYTGIDRLVEDVLSNLGNVEIAFVTGDYAQGKDTGIIDLVIVGEIDRAYLDALVAKVERLINRKIRHLVFNNAEYEHFSNMLTSKGSVVVWGEKRV